MRRSHLCWVASCLALSLSACATLKPPRVGTAKACTDWRWIGISRPEARCPEIPGWTVRPLFPQIAPASRNSDDFCTRKDSEKGDYCKEREAEAEVPKSELMRELNRYCDYCEAREAEKVPSPELIRQLNRFCVYEPKKGLKHRTFPPSASSDLVKFDQDCAAISITDRELDPKGCGKDCKTKECKKEECEAAVKDFIPKEPEKRPKIDNKLGVRLAFLDTQPDGEGVPERSGTSPHGFTLAHLARQLLCTPGSNSHCVAHITTRLALPIVKFDGKKFKHKDIDKERGGYLGMQSDLAEAIRGEVDTWHNAKAQRHLVLSLSLAWDGDFFGGLSNEQIAQMRAGTQAVYYALQYAASFDVLVLAAAGNQRIEPCANFGPLLPAAWEQKTPQDCPSQPQKTPLVYAVGGVQFDGVRLSNARPAGMPRRAAYGETAVLLAVNPETVYKEKFYSGSSVATAYASSIAAAVWSAFPDLDSHGVMKLLDDSGPELGFKADFWFGDDVQPVAHLLTLCTALKRACGEFTHIPCPIQPSCRDLKLAELPGQHPPGAEASSRGSCQAWMHPQPDDPPCPNTTCPPRQQ